MKISAIHPPAHARYVVMRQGLFFTATPCYGLHEPWWVVRTMGNDCKDEAAPEPMDRDDEWWPIEKVMIAEQIK